ncbi:MAG: hypothetical protein IPI63_11740 [Methanothrix sp.]|jgi:thioredoxin-like negative regulator of GroEL|uniref:hypothetical protein n=1 Tax=Methanothrix sp. TaxID=90426 RepID=UPI0025E485A2|nr:hypothetical protein [Methanothrix sp.]MBK7387335.1 hypothetical protein [Methanothrix sp.]
MIEAALAGQLAGILAPFLPKLMDTAAAGGMKVLESAAEKAGEAAWDKAVRVWNILRPEVKKDPEVDRAIQDVAKNAEDPDAKVALSWQLKKLTLPLETLAELQKIVAESRSEVRITSADRGGVAVGGSVSGSTITAGYHESSKKSES